MRGDRQAGSGADRGPAGRLAGLVAAGTVLLVLLAVAGALTGAPHLRHDSLLDTVFDTRWLIALTRLVALAVGLYLIGSVVALAGHGQWIRRVGPVDAEVVNAVAADQGQLQTELETARREIVTLRAELAEALAELDRLVNTGPTESDRPGEGRSQP